jgi:hypothetical protein
MSVFWGIYYRRCAACRLIRPEPPHLSFSPSPHLLQSAYPGLARDLATPILSLHTVSGNIVESVRTVKQKASPSLGRGGLVLFFLFLPIPLPIKSDPLFRNFRR